MLHDADMQYVHVKYYSLLTILHRESKIYKTLYCYFTIV